MKMHTHIIHIPGYMCATCVYVYKDVNMDVHICQHIHVRMILREDYSTP